MYKRKTNKHKRKTNKSVKKGRQRRRGKSKQKGGNVLNIVGMLQTTASNVYNGLVGADPLPPYAPYAGHLK